ncbi:uncharacterized protein LOC121261991 [Juglans microcarpa x Juglans regia]|uniref:uncharacterized protein LOC121261991 n=1 Tax=Juglans microcarpa x Juglans regia TaxID=2249226 RepID=UPI001B7EE6AC|nr:uncharacterized protein LOC121261991 [Juglans microcarpa x Juglans regia]
MCPICLREEESVMHAIWECPAATDVWAEQGSPVQKWSVGVKSFYQLWEEVHSKLTAENVEKMVFILRNIWYRRNMVVFDNKFLNPASIVQMSLSGYEDLKLARERKGEDAFQADDNASTSRGRGWKKPEGQLLKRLQRGGLCCSMSYKRGELWAFRAECIATWEAMVLCEELGLGEVIFEGDAKSVIDAVSSGEKDDSSYGHLVENLQ